MLHRKTSRGRQTPESCFTFDRPLPKTVERVFSPLTDFRFPPFMEQEFKFCPTSRLLSVHRPECRRLSCVTVWCFFNRFAQYGRFHEISFIDLPGFYKRQQNLKFLIS